MSDFKIRRALIAVYDKTGVAEFARALVNEFGIEIISTGGTARHLKEAGIPVTMVEEVTGFPELLDGRVKTLHPKIHAGILADRDNPEHMRQLEQHGIKPIDMVVVNLYPFEKTVADPNCKFEDAIEMIDIGGPCMLRAAAKNHRHVVVLSHPDMYDASANVWLLPNFRHDVAQHAIWTTAGYDAAIAAYLNGSIGEGTFNRLHTLRLMAPHLLRYGENPHVHAAAYEYAKFYKGDHVKSHRSYGASLIGRSVEGAVPVSYNNYLDADAALSLCAELTRAGAAQPVWHRFSTGDLWDRFATGPSQSTKGPIRREHITHRNLPHIQLPQATYFVTFRIRTGELHPTERDIVLAACQFWHRRKMTLHAAVVMPDHVHLLLTPHEVSKGEWVSLGELLHSIKRHAAREINLQRGMEGPLWLDESFDRVMRDEEEFVQKWNYMESNPVTAEIAKPGEYPWFWHSNTGFLETVSQHVDRLKTGPTTHRIQSGATPSDARTDTSQNNPVQTTDGLHICVFIKHTNACGVGVSDDPLDAYRQAYLGDPNAAMGSILAVNFPVDSAFAATVMATYDRFGKPLKEAGHTAAPGGFFIEVWVAPSFDEDAVAVIRGTAAPTAALPNPPKKKWGENIRLLDVGDMTVEPDPKEFDYKRIAGGMLVQTPDLVGLNEDQWRVVTKRVPSDREMADLRLAWLICKHTKSNAISICKDGMLIGNGAGQMSRVMSCRIATWLAKENGHADKLPGSVAASDAFFPFRDGPEILMEAGVSAIIQPGGSKRDDETIAACDERGVAMIFTGTRHFKH